MATDTKKKKLSDQLSVIRFVVIVLLTICLFLFYKFASGVANNYRAAQEVEQLQQKVTSLEDRQQSLEKRLEYVQTNDYVERIARTQLKWARPGETTVVVVPASRDIVPIPRPTPNVQPETNKNSESSWLAWWHLFFEQAPPVISTER